MFSKFKFVLVGLFVVALVAVGIGGTIVLAQGPTTTPAAPAAGATPTAPAAGATATPTRPPTTGTPTAPRTLADLYWQALAQRLGLSVDRLQQAIVDARRDAINQAVTQGLLTQAQADRLLQQLQNTVPGTVFDGIGRERAANQLREVYTSVRNAGLDAAARALGMSTTDLTAALRTRTLLAVANERNVDVTRLRTAIADAAKAAIDQAVRDGKLTQAQADAIKANITPNNINLNTRSLGIPLPGGLNQGLPLPDNDDDRGFPGQGRGRGQRR